MAELYTVGSTLQNILTRRKAEARQAMLDSVAQDKFELEKRESESRMANDAETAATNRVWREGQAEAARALAKERQTKTLDEIGLEPETAIAPGQLGPEQLTLGKETGRIVTDTTPLTGNIGDGYGEKHIWRGNAEQRQKHNNKKQRTGLIQELMKNPDANKDMINRLMIANAFGGDDMSAAELKAITSPDTGSEPTSVREYKFAQSQGYKGTFDQYQKEDANRRTPRPPANPIRYSWVGNDPKSGLPIKMENTTGDMYLPDGTKYIGPINPTRSGLGGGRILNDATQREYSDLMATYKNQVRTSGTDSRLALTTFEKLKVLGNTMVANANASPEVKQYVSDVIANDDRRPTSEIMEELKASGDPNDKRFQLELAQFWQILKTIRGE